MEKHDTSDGELCDVLDCSFERAMQVKWEHVYPGRWEMERIADHFGVTVDFLERAD